ncbi:hypothetical protein KL914_004994 [Ogataea haglerorum]|nr:hypothetical protein KL915_004958 [Ogataea haglerorum]KAG7702989.1 hypothetical protein KL914_004994 [Ogataea haglerorum]KAG7788997.1 hypothetical protein KL910_002695 [Ogataea haglerorum]KAG7790547.1 hypothetical protein KL945_001428 [Ogataea haglerorum]
MAARSSPRNSKYDIDRRVSDLVLRAQPADNLFGEIFIIPDFYFDIAGLGALLAGLKTSAGRTKRQHEPAAQKTVAVHTVRLASEPAERRGGRRLQHAAERAGRQRKHGANQICAAPEFRQAQPGRRRRQARSANLRSNRGKRQRRQRKDTRAEQPDVPARVETAQGARIEGGAGVGRGRGQSPGAAVQKTDGYTRGTQAGKETTLNTFTSSLSSNINANDLLNKGKTFFENLNKENEKWISDLHSRAASFRNEERPMLRKLVGQKADSSPLLPKLRSSLGLFHPSRPDSEPELSDEELSFETHPCTTDYSLSERKLD